MYASHMCGHIVLECKNVCFSPLDNGHSKKNYHDGGHKTPEMDAWRLYLNWYNMRNNMTEIQRFHCSHLPRNRGYLFEDVIPKYVNILMSRPRTNSSVSHQNKSEASLSCSKTDRIDETWRR